jgi:hypothetical protein
VDVFITDLEALGKVCDGLGLDLIKGKTQYAWWGTSVGDTPLPAGRTKAQLGTCEHAIQIKGMPGRMGSGGPWEIGVVKRPDGKPGFTLEYDNYGMHGQMLERKAGVQMNILKKELATEVARRQMVRDGYRVRLTENAQGQRQLVCER